MKTDNVVYIPYNINKAHVILLITKVYNHIKTKYVVSYYCIMWDDDMKSKFVDDTSITTARDLTIL